MILDLFAGPGGWSEGLRSLGHHDIGIEWDKAACATRAAAGHLTVRADVAQYPTEPFAGKVTGLIASPPCQAWSMAGKREGEKDRALVHALAEKFARGYDGDPLWAGTVPDEWADRRSHLVAQPVRWVRALRPEWVALEQVPPVVGLWQHLAHLFEGWGYRCWVGVLNSADYGVPQTRERAILMARLDGSVAPPAPTHCNGGSPDGLFGAGLLPWVSMAEALGWGLTDRGSFTVTGGGGGGGGVEVFARGGRDAMARAQRRGAWIRTHQNSEIRAGVTERYAREWHFYQSSRANATKRNLDEPAPSIYFGHALNEVGWAYERPATTIAGTFAAGKVAAQGHHGVSTYEQPEAVRITVQEAAVLQSFRPDYPWQGSRTKQFEQVGNAVPPRLAAAILGELVGAATSEAVA